MANHKRKRPKNARAGCLMCKPHKMNGNNERSKLKEDVDKEIELGTVEHHTSTDDLCNSFRCVCDDPDCG